MQKTEHYALSQYEPDDRVTREAVNADNAAIDAAIAEAAQSGGAEVIFSSYAGDGSDFRTINLGFKPKWILVFSDKGYVNSGSQRCDGLMGPNSSVRDGTGNGMLFSMIDYGFRIINGNSTYYTNRVGETYYYLVAK